MTPWYRSAACADTPVNVFFPDETDSAAYEHAKRICGTCSVREACLDAALSEEGGRGISGRHGIRGGKGPTGRRREYERRTRGGQVVTPPKIRTASARPAGWNRPKLTEEQRAEIRALAATGRTIGSLSRQFGVTRRSVRQTLAKAPATVEVAA